jgi:parallel beta-helix repeat protein
VLRGLRVVGADEGFGPFPSAVDFRDVGRGSARDLVLEDTCDRPGPDEGAEYGVNVFHSRKVSVAGNDARGFSDAGLYVGQITSTGNGALSVHGNVSRGNNRGVIVEDSAGGRIVVKNNELNRNRAAGEGTPSGIFLHNADGVEIEGNAVNGDGEIGIHLDPNSDDNALHDNVVRDNPTNLLDEGSGNCGSGNRFGDSGNLLPPC